MRACVCACVRRRSRTSLCQSVPLPGCDVDAHSGRTLLSVGPARPNPPARRGTIKTRVITLGSSPGRRGMFRRSRGLCNRHGTEVRHQHRSRSPPQVHRDADASTGFCRPSIDRPQPVGSPPGPNRTCCCEDARHVEPCHRWAVCDGGVPGGVRSSRVAPRATLTRGAGCE